MRADRHLRLLASLALFASTASCTLWFALEQDPGGLPCAPDRKCLVGYTCNADDLCVKAGDIALGQVCTIDEECVSGAVCTNVFDEASCGEDINCALGRDGRNTDADQLRCHTSCQPQDAVADWGCSLGETCHPDAVQTNPGWCQSGTCSTPSDCGVNNNNGGEPNVCVGGDVNPGGPSGTGSGLCLESCSPLDCNETTGCQTCSLLDRDGVGGDDLMTCRPATIGNVVHTELPACFAAGGAQADQACDGSTTLCAPGSFCSTVFTGEGAGFCVKWCDVSGGNPACNAAHPTCNPVAGRNYGFCS